MSQLPSRILRRIAREAKRPAWRVARWLSFNDINRFRLLEEPAVLSRFLRFLNVDCVFDVGANEGQYAARLRRETKFAGHIFSFEPDPDVVKALAQNAARDRSWHVEALALSTSNGQRPFNVIDGSALSSFHTPTASGNTTLDRLNIVHKSILVGTERLDNALPRLRLQHGFQNPFLKIDTQGHEQDVLEGAGERIDDFVGIQCEMCFGALYENTSSATDVISMLRERGFVLSDLVPNHTGFFPRLLEMDGMFIREDLIPSGR